MVSGVQRGKEYCGRHQKQAEEDESVKQDRRRYFTALWNNAGLSTEIGFTELILLLIGVVLFLTINCLP